MYGHMKNVKTIITGRNEVVAKVIFLHLSVIHSVHRGGVCFSACWDNTPPGADTPLEQTPSPGADPPWSRHPRSRPPRSRHPTEQTPPEQTPFGADIPLGLSTPPREADSGIRSTSGQYASYWNAFLFMKCTFHMNTAKPD